MGSLDTWGAIAATLLLIECIIFNLIFVALAFGLWKGSAWLLEHARLGLTKVDEWLRLGRGYVMRGQQLLVLPFVRARGRAEGLRALRGRLKE